IGSGALLPDATLLLEVDPGTAAARVAARDGADADRIGSREAAYFAHVGETFARLAADEPARVRRIDGSGSVEAVHARVLRALEPLIEDAAA
ncbi:MAG: thymidylate kinase, partial [Novosphingobium sp.]